MHYYAIKKRQEAEQLFCLLQKGVFTDIEDNFGSFVANQKAVIKNTKILSYLSKVTPLLEAVIKETTKPFAEIQGSSELLATVAPQTSPQEMLFVLFNYYSKYHTALPDNMIVNAAISAICAKYPVVNSDNFGDFLVSIGIANIKGPYQDFLYSKIVH